ncbi:metallophosphoesterase [Afipia sp. P52-10]|uniref:metallophosphoesterase n=1 Tax=Afipia sp. P52-10 TaxID=1429916 RepID=UPI000686DD43|nr:metallophosphoesterase [Afipia sp. P52-10]
MTNSQAGSSIDLSAWAASTPRNTRIYAVGDVHGRADLLAEMTERIDDDCFRRPVQHAIEVYLGDYIDRGVASKDVIDILCRRLVRRNAICLRGNHEALLERFIIDPTMVYDWARLGGLETLNSYGVAFDADQSSLDTLHGEFCSAFPRTHTLFLRCLKNMYRCGNYLFVHAGIRPGVPLAAQTQEDLTWIRDEFLTSTVNHGYVVVHGHTPVMHPEIHKNRINIDTGAFYSGTLTCVVLEDTSIQFL